MRASSVRVLAAGLAVMQAGTLVGQAPMSAYAAELEDLGTEEVENGEEESAEAEEASEAKEASEEEASSEVEEASEEDESSEAEEPSEEEESTEVEESAEETSKAEEPTEEEETSEVEESSEAEETSEVEETSEAEETSESEESTEADETLENDLTVPEETESPANGDVPAKAPAKAPMKAPAEAKVYKITVVDIVVDEEGNELGSETRFVDELEEGEEYSYSALDDESLTVVGKTEYTGICEGDLTIEFRYTSDDLGVNLFLAGIVVTADGKTYTTDENGHITEPEKPAKKEGYGFKGWSRTEGDTDKNNKIDFSTEVFTEDTTIYPIFTRNQYTVIYDTQGGSAIASQEYGDMAALNLPEGDALPTKEGFTFSHWALTPTGTAIDHHIIWVEEDMTVYAVWKKAGTPVKVTIGDTGDVFTTNDDGYLSAPTMNGNSVIYKGCSYTQYDRNFDNAIDFTTEVFTKDTTVYLLYVKVWVHVDGENAGGIPGLHALTQVRKDNNHINRIPSDPDPRDGYEFKGWSLTEGDTDESNKLDLSTYEFSATSDTDIYPIWVSTRSAVTVTADGKTYTADDQGKISDPTAPTNKEGYEFKGWSRTEGDTDESNKIDFSSEVFDTDIEIYPIWVIKSTSVTVTADGKTYMTDENGHITTPGRLSDKERYYFCGWSRTEGDTDDGNGIDFSKEVFTEDTEIYPIWVKMYIVTAGNKQYITNSSGHISYPDNPSNKPGYIFKGWSRTEGDTDVNNKIIQSKEVFTEDTTIYPIWVPAVVVRADGKEYTVSEDGRLYHNNPSVQTIKDGYKFVGWSLTENDVDESNKLDLSRKVFKENTEIFPIWLPVDESVVTVTVVDCLLGQIYDGRHYLNNYNSPDLYVVERRVRTVDTLSSGDSKNYDTVSYSDYTGLDSGTYWMRESEDNPGDSEDGFDHEFKYAGNKRVTITADECDTNNVTLTYYYVSPGFFTYHDIFYTLDEDNKPLETERVTLRCKKEQAGQLASSELPGKRLRTSYYIGNKSLGSLYDTNTGYDYVFTNSDGGIERYYVYKGASCKFTVTDYFGYPVSASRTDPIPADAPISANGSVLLIKDEVVRQVDYITLKDKYTYTPKEYEGYNVRSISYGGRAGEIPVKLKTSSRIEGTAVIGSPGSISFYYVKKINVLADSKNYTTDAYYHISEPVEPDPREGYEFKGWSRTEGDINEGNKINFSREVFTEDTAIYPIWISTRSAVTVTADSKTYTADDQGKITTPDDPADKEGYEFKGWSRTEGDTNPDNKLDFTSEVFDTDTEIYPIWVAVSSVVTVTADGKTYTADENGHIMEPDVPAKKEGYEFKGWSRTEGDTNPDNKLDFTSEVFDVDTEIYPIWIAVSSVVTVTADGKTYTVDDQGKITTPDSPASKDGYWFKGWSRTENDANPDNALDFGNEVFDSDTEIYPIWVKKVVVTADGKTYTANENGKVSIWDTPSKEGYIFAGWSRTDGDTNPDNKIDFWEEVFTSDTEIYPIWVQQFTVTADGKTYKTNVIGHISTPDKPAAKPDHIFGGWSRTENDTNPDNALDFSNEVFDADTEIYPIWVSEVKVRVIDCLMKGSSTECPLGMHKADIYVVEERERVSEILNAGENREYGLIDINGYKPMEDGFYWVLESADDKGGYYHDNCEINIKDNTKKTVAADDADSAVITIKFYYVDENVDYTIHDIFYTIDEDGNKVVQKDETRTGTYPFGEKLADNVKPLDDGAGNPPEGYYYFNGSVITDKPALNYDGNFAYLDKNARYKLTVKDYFGHIEQGTDGRTTYIADGEITRQVDGYLPGEQYNYSAATYDGWNETTEGFYFNGDYIYHSDRSGSVYGSRTVRFFYVSDGSGKPVPGGDVKDKVTVTADGKTYTADDDGHIRTPDNPSNKEGYEFKGWSRTEGDTNPDNKLDFSKEVFTEDSTIYPIWVKKVVTVTADGKTYTADENGKITTPDNPASKPGYIFKGWSLTEGDTDPGNALDFSKQVFTTNTEVYPIWVKAAVVTADGKPYTADENGHIKTPDYPADNPGYVFGGWSRTEGDTDPDNKLDFSSEVFDTDTEIYPIWVDANSVVKVTADGRTYAADSKGHITTPVDPAPRPGYIFAGWSRTEGDTNPDNKLDFSSEVFDTDTEVYPIWVKEYTVTAGGKDYKTDIDGHIPTPDKPDDKPGYTFAGWSRTEGDPDDTNKIDFGSEVFTEDTEVYPIWVKGVTVTADGKSYTADSDGHIRIPDNPAAKDGYIFAGWSRVEGDTNPDNKLDFISEVFVSDTEIFPIWVKEHTVTADGKDYKTDIDGHIPTPDKPADKDGYEFKGWSRTEGDTDPGNKIDFSKEVFTSDSEIYPIWVKVDSVVTVTADGKTYTADDNGHIRTPDAPANKPGYTFKGWSLVQGDTNPDNAIDFSTKVFTANTEIYPIWVAVHSGGSSSGSSSGGSDRSSSSGRSSYQELSGSWVHLEDGRWRFKLTDGSEIIGKWAYLKNPYAVTSLGQNEVDWFRFDDQGYMVTGWYTDVDGNIYYLHPVSDGSQGHMYTGWHWIEGTDGLLRCYYFNIESDGTKGALYRSKTAPDGSIVDENGAWVVGDGAVTREAVKTASEELTVAQNSTTRSILRSVSRMFGLA